MKKDGRSGSRIDRSLFLNLLNSFIAKVSKAIADSAVFSFIRGAGEKLLSEKTRIFAKPKKLAEKLHSPLLSAKRAVARQFAESRCLKGLEKLKDIALSVSLRTIGIGLFFFGLYGAILSLIGSFTAGRWYFDSPALIESIIILAAAVLCFLSTKPLILLLCESNTFSGILENVVCIRTEDVKMPTKVYRLGSVALVIGTVLGIMTVAVDPIDILKVIGVALIALCVWRSPEFGLNILILLFPFLTEGELALVAAGTFISYLVKLMRGKRVFDKSFSTLLPVVVGSVALIRYFISPDGSPADFSLIMSIPILYVVAVNLLRSKKLLRSATDMMCISFYLFIGARFVYCILEYLGHTGLLQLSVSANLCSPSLFAEYTMLCMGFALFALTKTTRFARRAVLETLIAISLTIVIAMGDLRLTLCCILAILLFILLARSDRTLFSIPFIMLLPTAYILFPELPFMRLVGVFTVSSSSIEPLYGKDLMYIFGLGGIGLIILLALFLLAMGLKLHAKEQTDRVERGIFAAVSSTLLTYILYCVLTGIETHHASALFIAATAAIASALGKRGLEKEEAMQSRADLYGGNINEKQ